jgi:hypothetical protein
MDFKQPQDCIKPSRNPLPTAITSEPHSQRHSQQTFLSLRILLFLTTVSRPNFYPVISIQFL